MLENGGIPDGFTSYLKYEPKGTKSVQPAPKTNLRVRRPNIPAKAALSTLQILLMSLFLLFIICVVLFLRFVSISSREEGEDFEGPEAESFLSYHEHKL